MLKKEINPMKIKKYTNSKRDMEKNLYFKDFKSQWDNEMHYVVDEYKSNIFPNAHEYHSSNMAHQVAQHSLSKAMQKERKAPRHHNPDEESSHSLDSVPESHQTDENQNKLEVVGTKRDPINKKFMVFVDKYARSTKQTSPKINSKKSPQTTKMTKTSTTFTTT